MKKWIWLIPTVGLYWGGYYILDLYNWIFAEKMQVHQATLLGWWSLVLAGVFAFGYWAAKQFAGIQKIEQLLLIPTLAFGVAVGAVLAYIKALGGILYPEALGVYILSNILVCLIVMYPMKS